MKSFQTAIFRNKSVQLRFFYFLLLFQGRNSNIKHVLAKNSGRINFVHYFCIIEYIFTSVMLLIFNDNYYLVELMAILKTLLFKITEFLNRK